MLSPQGESHSFENVALYLLCGLGKSLQEWLHGVRLTVQFEGQSPGNTLTYEWDLAVDGEFGGFGR